MMIRKLIGIAIQPVIAAAMIAAASSPASAAVEISWNDFSRTYDECWDECVREEFARCTGVHCDEYGCYYYDDICGPYCVEYRQFCRTERLRLPSGDLIDVTIEHNATASDGIEFRLRAGPDVNSWKQITISDGTDTWRVWTFEEWWSQRYFCNWPLPETPGCDTIGHWAGPTIERGQIVFSKAGFLWFHEDVYVLRNLGQRLSPGDRVTFHWVED